MSGASRAAEAGGAPRARLFVALFPPEDLARELAAAARGLLAGERSLRLVRAAELHLTLCFVGERERAAVAPLAAALGRELEGARAPRVRLGPTGCFPERGRPRVWWIGLGDGEGRLGELARRARRAAGEPAEGGEGAWRAHLTLARTRGPGGGPPREVERAFRALAVDGGWEASEVALVESRLERREDRYERLWSAALVRDEGR